MEINRICKLFLKNVHLYDIISCHYIILKRIGYNINHIDKDDKKKRNIEIGIMMRDNPNLTTILRDTTAAIIDDCLLRNNIKDEDLILRQYDGFLITKTLRETNIHFPLDLRAVYSQFIISSCRNMYVALTENGDEFTIKGMSHKYEAMSKLLEKLIKKSGSGNDTIFKTLAEIKDEVLFSNDPRLYAIPVKENTFSIMLKKYGQYQVSKSFMKILDTDDIDKEWYYNNYVRPFAESVVIEFA
jgi:hypothetical protein